MHVKIMKFSLCKPGHLIFHRCMSKNFFILHTSYFILHTSATRVTPYFILQPPGCLILHTSAPEVEESGAQY